jgi:copper chaperone
MSVSPTSSDSAPTIIVKVPGMTCGHCKSAVTEEVSALADVTAVDVDLDTKIVTISVTDADREGLLADIVAAIDEAGFAVA